MIQYIQLGLSIIGIPLASIITYVLAKRLINTEKVMEIIDDFLSEVHTNTDLQKKIYSVGLLVGSGIAQGTGLNTVTKGSKFKTNDILSLGLQYFLGKFMPQLNQQQESTVSNEQNGKVGL